MKRVLRSLLIIILIAAMVTGIIPCDYSEAKIENEMSESTFWIKFIDVKQGDAALIQCDGHYMLIDGGPSSASSVIYAILKRDKIKVLDYMIATHPDADHIGGLSGALNYAKANVCYSPVTTHDTKTFDSLLKYLDKRGGTLLVPEAGTSFELGSAKVEMLGPVKEGDSTNNMSIVTKITYGKTSFLFMGDAEISEEKSLMSAKSDLSCDLLKVSHHGSKGATSTKFLKKAKPQFAVISVGADNPYGHPTAETLKRLKKAKVSVFRTDLQGDIVCYSDGVNLSFTTKKDTPEESIWNPGELPKDPAIIEGLIIPTDDVEDIPDGTTFVINKNSNKFHLLTCDSVKDIAPKNKAYSNASVEELTEAGYKPCGGCKPADKNRKNE